MPKFRKKPIVIEAIQFDATNENLAELSEFVQQRTLHFDLEREKLIIETLEGDHVARKGDWIIKGIAGECYPCRPDIFVATYESVSEEEIEKTNAPSWAHGTPETNPHFPHEGPAIEWVHA